MNEVERVRKERDGVLEEMRGIESMARGTINEQYFPVIRQGKKTGQKRGPYYVWSRRQGKRTVSKRLRSAAQLQQARADLAAHQRFVALCQEFEALTERLGQLQRDEGGVGPEKKRCRSRSRRIGK